MISFFCVYFKNLQFKTAPQTMSFELELKQRQEEFSRNEATLMKEISILKLENRFFLVYNFLALLIFLIYEQFKAKKRKN